VRSLYKKTPQRPNAAVSHLWGEEEMPFFFSLLLRGRLSALQHL